MLYIFDLCIFETLKNEQIYHILSQLWHIHTYIYIYIYTCCEHHQYSKPTLSIMPLRALSTVGGSSHHGPHPASPPQPPAGPPDQWYVNSGQVSIPGVWASCISMLQSWRSSITPKFKLFSSFIDVADGLPKTCFNVRTSGGGDGYYILDPEQDGLDPISVFCNVSRTPVTAVLHHNQENWTHVHGYEDVRSYNGQVRHVTNAGLDGKISMSSCCLHAIISFKNPLQIAIIITPFESGNHRPIPRVPINSALMYNIIYHF